MPTEKRTTVPYAFRARLEHNRHLGSHQATIKADVTGTAHPLEYNLDGAVEVVTELLRETMPDWRVEQLQIRSYGEEWL